MQHLLGAGRAQYLLDKNPLHEIHMYKKLRSHRSCEIPGSSIPFPRFSKTPFLSPQTCPSNISQRSTTHDRQAHNHPAGPDDLLVPKLPPGVPHQMPHPIDTVETERHRDPELDQELRHRSEAAEPLGQARALQMPSEHRAHQVGRPEDVEAPRQDRCGDPVQAREDPGDLRAVDGQVWRDRTVQALFGQDRVRVRRLRRRRFRGGGGRGKGDEAGARGGGGRVSRVAGTVGGGIGEGRIRYRFCDGRREMAEAAGGK